MTGERQVAATLASPGAGARARLKVILCETVLEVSSAWHRDHLRAIVLTGSLARDEASFLGDLSSCTLLGDAEFLLVFERSSALPAPAEMRRLQAAVEEALLRRNVHAQIGLSAVTPHYFSALKPAIFSYELRTCGQVAWGDPQILSRIRPFPASGIPLEDAWRLMSNRMIELLESSAGSPGVGSWSCEAVRYASVKLCLDMATSFLLFAGAYAPTYRERQANLAALAASAAAPLGGPFALCDFAALVSLCTAWKLCPDARTTALDAALWPAVHSFAARLWRWELCRLTGADEIVSGRELLRLWMRMQPILGRLWGWAYVLRKCGWHRSWRDWPRWSRRAWRASPRYWVYAAASELFAQLPLARLRGEADYSLDNLLEWLPVCRPGLQNAPSAWHAAANQIAWNYHQFLTETRA
jgi:hypothetical protein